MFADLLTSDIRLTYGTIAEQSNTAVNQSLSRISRATICLLCDSILKFTDYTFAASYVSEDFYDIINKDFYHFIYLYL